MDAKLEDLAHRVIGAAIAVHRELGAGYLESVYEEALAAELEIQSVPFARQVVFGVEYGGRPVGEGRLDLLVDDEPIVELKAVEAFASIHMAQILSYLKANKKRLGLLNNFNVPILKNGIKRVAL